MDEAMRSIAVIGVFVGLAVGWAGVERWVRGDAGRVDSGRGDPSGAPYSSRRRGASEPKRSLHPSIWLVDGFNVLHAAVLRSGRLAFEDWWKGRNRDRVVDLARGLRWRSGRRRRRSCSTAARSRRSRSRAGRSVVFAASADEWLLAAVRADARTGPHRRRDRGPPAARPAARSRRAGGVAERVRGALPRPREAPARGFALVANRRSRRGPARGRRRGMGCGEWLAPSACLLDLRNAAPPALSRRACCALSRLRPSLAASCQKGRGRIRASCSRSPQDLRSAACVRRRAPLRRLRIASDHHLRARRLGCAADVRGQHDVRKCEQRTRGIERFAREDVESGRGEASVAQRRGERRPRRRCRRARC